MTDMIGGLSLSPAIVVGYLMGKYDWNFDRALAYVQSKRYCVSPMSVSCSPLKLPAQSQPSLPRFH